MNFQLTDEQNLIRKTAREFAANELAPGVVERDEKKIWPKDAVTKMARLGFLGMMVDPKYGGAGMVAISYVLALEEIITKIGIKASECGYAGDDTLDIPLLNIVGLPVTVQNAHPEVKKICKYTTIKTGGHGAVREICDLLINARKKR